MSIQAITGASGKPIAAVMNTPPHPAAQAAQEGQKTAPTKPPSTAADSVQISKVSQVAYQEATETAAQTAKEARNGDRQAIRLQAKEEAAHAAPTPTETLQKPEKLLQ